MQLKLSRRIRTVLYDDQRFAATEIDLLHTPALQRLYDLHQLGLTDRVFIDASHSRLHHVVGAVEQADKMMRAIITNLRKAPSEKLPFAGGPAEGMPKERLADHAENKISTVRIMALLHDLTHSPYGHTLEDEIELLPEKHDQPERQANAYYRLVLQYFAWIERNQTDKAWGVNSRERPDNSSPQALLDWHLDAPDIHVPPEADEFIEFFAKRWASFLRPGAKRRRTLRRIPAAKLAEFVRDLHFAMRALLHLDIAHRDKDALERGRGRIPRSDYAVDKLLRGILKHAGIAVGEHDVFTPQRDVFLLDVLANTICADLLDYARRDAVWAGIKLNYDADRIVENMTVTSHQITGPIQLPQANGEMVDFPLAGACLRTCVSLFSHKLRTDVPGELMSLLQARYSVYERMLYHPTKCVAGAVLGAAIQFIGWRKLPANLRYVGDSVFLFQVSEAAKLVRDLLSKIRGSRVFNAELAEELRKQVLALPVNGISAAALQLIQDRLVTVGDLVAQLKISAQFRDRSDELELSRTARQLIESENSEELLERALRKLESETVHKPSGAEANSFAVRWLRAKLPTAQAIVEELKAGLRLLDRLYARRYLKITFRLLPNAVVPDVGVKAPDVAALFKRPVPRKMAEREIERRAGLPPGSIVIHCPPVKGPTKIARILIASADAFDGTKGRKVETLNEIGSIDPDVFEMHEQAVHALGEMYRSTWRFAVSVAPPFDADWEKINAVVAKVLREMLTDVDGPPLANDRYTLMEMEALEVAIAQLDARERAAEMGAAEPSPHRTAKPKRADFDREISEEELAELLGPYISITSLARLPDPRLKAVLIRVRNLHALGLDVFKKGLPEPELLGRVGEHDVKKDGYERLLRMLRNAVTKAEEAAAAAEA